MPSPSLSISLYVDLHPFSPTENMDCRMPMGTPQTVLMRRRTPTPGRARRRVMAETLNRLWSDPF